MYVLVRLYAALWNSISVIITTRVLVLELGRGQYYGRVTLYYFAWVLENRTERMWVGAVAERASCLVRVDWRVYAWAGWGEMMQEVVA